eukprot:CAMPEP_0182857546 /NCGR_PEP_ID=MMETSP0034_2-20130328/3114_1 /TAXON_ID=156128 /ORGANISM="Nephroselmis pyriformis, Strain CCMP717" /LENGTH=124 /DNA_ID=CAMNT_0024988791 /DNA_START=197 /DNA_END=571 /DNA_ORIENTATION=-
MKRNPRKVRWTKAFRKGAGKELATDSTFEFERRRNRPEKYDRNLMAKTLKAIKKVEEVRITRQSKFYDNRMKGKKARDVEAAKEVIEKEIHLIEAPQVTRARKEKGEKLKVKVSKKQGVQAMDE